MEFLTKAIEQWQAANKSVAELENEINVTNTSNYYDTFGGEAERQKDLADMRKSLRIAIDLEHGALDNLIIARNLRKVDLNEQLRFITLQKAS